MANTPRQKSKIHSTINEHCIPELGTFGDVWIAKAEHTVWYATRSGVVVNLTDLLNNEVAHTPPRAGRDGVDGRDGAKGERGTAGAAGRDGADSTIPGPAGRDGLHGRNGKDCQCKLELAEQYIARLEKNLSESRDAIAAVRAEVADIAFQCKALRDASVKGQMYIQFLRSRVAEKLATRSKKQ